MKLAFNARALGLDLTAARSIEVAAAARFDALDLMVRDLVDAGDDPAGLAARLEDLGLEPGAFPLPTRWRLDQATFDSDLTRLPTYAAAAERLGLRVTGTWVLPARPPAGSPAASDPGPGPLLDWHVSRLAPIGRILADHGIALALEVLGAETSRAGWGPAFVTRVGQLPPMLAALEAVGARPAVLLDTFHLIAAGERPEELSDLWPRVAWVHLAEPAEGPGPPRDEDRALPSPAGPGDLPLLLGRLAAAGFAGPVTVEPFGTCAAIGDRGPEDRARLACRAGRSVLRAI